VAVLSFFRWLAFNPSQLSYHSADLWLMLQIQRLRSGCRGQFSPLVCKDLHSSGTLPEEHYEHKGITTRDMGSYVSIEWR